MKLNSIFQDGAVLQRDIAIPVWGSTTPNAFVKAALNGMEAYTRSTTSGSFLLRLPAMPAGGPYELTVTNECSGDKVVVRDVLVGDVWVASGQSNMQYLLGSDWAPQGSDPEGEIPVRQRQLEDFCATIPDSFNLRFFTVTKVASGIRESDAEGSWQRMTPENAPNCTAVGAWFGKYIQEALKIPVGIIHTSWGGTIAEAWTSRNGLMRYPATAVKLSVIDKREQERKTWEENMEGGDHFEAITQVDSGNTGIEKGWAKPGFDDSAWSGMMIPGSWIDQRIGGNGAAWFRLKLTVPASWKGHNLVIKTAGIDKHDITYFNGVEVGRTGKDFETAWWNRFRAYPVKSELVRFGEVNTIAIRAYSFLYQGGFWGKDTDYRLCCEDTGESLSIAGLWHATMEYDLGIKQPWAQLMGLGPGNPNTPGILFDGMIAPILPYAIRGVIWYQGESNAKEIYGSIEYRKLLGNMIDDWRYNWGQGDFPFIQVQLANYRTPHLYQDSSWAYLRESQRLVCKDYPNVSMIPALDIGSCDDIHPQNKKDVGKRLADNALYNVYGKPDAVPCGPMFRSIHCEGHEIRVYFDFADGMYLAEDSFKSFYLADAAGIFKAATSARIDGNSVVLSSEEIPQPLNVRYAWSDNPTSTLFNGAGYPASSFSTL